MRNKEKQRAHDRKREPARKCDPKRKAQKAAASARYRARLPRDEHLATRRKRWAERGTGRLRRYGLTPEQVRLIWINQLCACPICKADLPDPQKGHVDHDHATGAVRGLLCGTCNRGIGYLKDSAGNCARAAAYLSR